MTYAKEKDKLKIYELLNDKKKCRMFTMNVPISKLDKNRLNVYIFIILHLVALGITFNINIRSNNLSKLGIYDNVLGIFVITIYSLVLLNYLYLLVSYPGVISTTYKTSLLVFKRNYI